MATIKQLTEQYNLNEFEQELLNELGVGDQLEMRPGVWIKGEVYTQDGLVAHDGFIVLDEPNLDIPASVLIRESIRADAGDYVADQWWDDLHRG